jgi:hypothetical protein
LIRQASIIIITVSLLSTGCFEFVNKAAPSPGTVGLLGGKWTSTTDNASSLLSSCTNFQWNVTEKTATTGAGWFTATCFGVLQVTGSARGTMAGSNVNWIATAVANGGGVSDCAVALSGTATLATDHISIPYSGTTCMGPVSGTEMLKRD